VMNEHEVPVAHSLSLYIIFMNSRVFYITSLTTVLWSPGEYLLLITGSLGSHTNNTDFQSS